MNKSRYSRDDRRNMVRIIENLKNDEDYVAIFEILTDDPSITYTPNSNGVFLNLSTVSDSTLKKIKTYLKHIDTNRHALSDDDSDIISANINTKPDRAYKLSNYEKNILKQRNLKKVLNEDNEYEELKFATNKKKTSQPKRPRKVYRKEEA